MNMTIHAKGHRSMWTMRKYYSLYGRLLNRQVLYEAFRHVKRSKGAAGIDGQSLVMFGESLDVELSRLLLELKEKRYQSSPVKRVVIGVLPIFYGHI